MNNRLLTENNLLLMLAVVIIVSLVVVIISFRLPETRDQVVVGCVMIGEKTDNGWNESHYNGLLKACNAHECELKYVESVKEDRAELFAAVGSLVRKGCNVIFLTSFGYAQYTEEIAKYYPNVMFFRIYGDSRLSNCVTYFARLYQMRCLSGIVAGCESRTGIVGYVAAMPNYQIIRHINAFAMGMRKANPNAKLLVKFTFGWENEEVERESVALLQEKGADVIAYHQDRPYVMWEAEERGLYTIGFGSVYQGYSERMLTAALYNWELVYGKVLGDYIKGGESYSRDYWLGMQDNAVALQPLSPLASERSSDMVSAEKELILSGHSLFSNIIRDNNGVLRCEEGERISDEELLTGMDWFVEGVEVYE